MFLEVTVREPGFAVLFVSNEHPTYVDVYFDDITVRHTPSPIMQMDDYYPFGLTFNSYSRENSVENRYLYNQGTGDKTFHTERQFDLGLNVDQSRDRTYDYITGRWWQVDPKADEEGQEVLSPYQYSYNNPVKYNDPYGDCPWCIGALVGAATDYVLQVATNLAQGKDLGSSLTEVDVTSIVVSAGAGALSGGLSTLSKLKNASTLVKVATEVAVDAGSSAANQLATEGKVHAKSVVIDVVAGQTVGKKAGDLVEKAAKNTPAAKLLAKDLDRAQRVAGSNPRPARAEKVEAAQKKLDSYVKSRSVATGVSSSNVASKAYKTFTGTDDKKKEEKK
ncbi:MAG: hypothetical protein NZM13_12560 [Cyclobacteriaceae bacterium]|nr:hypothetical protein [Cyclobacteriaceae bacterium]